MVSYARSTYIKAKEFSEKLDALQNSVPPALIRTYLAAAKIAENSVPPESGVAAAEAARKSCGVSLGLTDEQILQIEELRTIRKSAVQGEMKYALVQAEKNGIQLDDDIVSGEAVLPALSRELLEKVPSLGVYNLFLLFTQEEFDAHL